MVVAFSRAKLRRWEIRVIGSIGSTLTFKSHTGIVGILAAMSSTRLIRGKPVAGVEHYTPLRSSYIYPSAASCLGESGNVAQRAVVAVGNEEVVISLPQFQIAEIGKNLPTQTLP